MSISTTVWTEISISLWLHLATKNLRKYTSHWSVDPLLIARLVRTTLVSTTVAFASKRGIQSYGQTCKLVTHTKCATSTVSQHFRAIFSLKQLWLIRITCVSRRITCVCISNQKNMCLEQLFIFFQWSLRSCYALSTVCLEGQNSLHFVSYSTNQGDP